MQNTAQQQQQYSNALSTCRLPGTVQQLCSGKGHGPVLAMTPTAGCLKGGQRLRVACLKPALCLLGFAGMGHCKDTHDMTSTRKPDKYIQTAIDLSICSSSRSSSKSSGQSSTSTVT
jgi:hypothetical protein